MEIIDDAVDVENSKVQMRKGLLEYCILLVISRGKIYAQDILKEMKEADLIVVEGTIYPLLSRLKNSGLLEYLWEESKNGPPRKYYSLTLKGRDNLDNLDSTWQKLSKSINSLSLKHKK
ncbi:MAG: PadR family transcriptional regulator [Candidatus Paceibacterota bacterium]|jgi:PadR family transcriptional regulator PadR